MRQGKRLNAILPDFTIDVYEERHHFDPPHRAEPERVAAALRYLRGLAGHMLFVQRCNGPDS